MGFCLVGFFFFLILNYKFLGRIYYSWTSNAFLSIYYFSNYKKIQQTNQTKKSKPRKTHQNSSNNHTTNPTKPNKQNRENLDLFTQTPTVQTLSRIWGTRRSLKCNYNLITTHCQQTESNSSLANIAC